MSNICSIGPHGRATQPTNALLFACICVIGKKHLIVAMQAQMGTCSTCEKLKEMRRKAVLPEQRDQAAATQSAHVAAVLKDRRVDALVQGKAEESIMASNPGSPWAETILNWDKIGWTKQNFGAPAILR